MNYLERERKMTVHCIFGYSAGGNVAVMYASKHPGRIPFITAFLTWTLTRTVSASL